MELAEINNVLTGDMSVRDKAILLGHKILGMEGVTKDRAEIDRMNPLEHFFADGMYIRKITMPAGQFHITMTHKQTHPYFLLSGSLKIVSDDGIEEIEGPCFGITKAGTKRIILVEEEAVWVNVFKTDKTDLDEIREELTIDDFDENLLTKKQKDLLCHSDG